MKVDVISNENNPYILDRIMKKPNLAALTRKNADFIEAVVYLDSNYNAETDHESESGTAYWFKKMMNNPDDYDECLMKTIELIDRTNSTHLESTINGRKRMFDIIRNYCYTVNELKDAVCVNPTQFDCDNLFYRMCETMLNHKGDKANNISFASKYIAYSRKYLNNNDVSFSKYDSVVSQKLSLYENIYVDSNIEIDVNKFKNKASDRKHLNDIERQKYTYDVYIKYMNAINSILDCLERDNNIKITKEEFDHIIWYSSKGK